MNVPIYLKKKKIPKNSYTENLFNWPLFKKDELVQIQVDFDKVKTNKNLPIMCANQQRKSIVYP